MVTKFLALGGVGVSVRDFSVKFLQCLKSLKLFQKHTGFFPPKGIEKYKLINLKFRFGDPKHWEYLTLALPQ